MPCLRTRSLLVPALRYGGTFKRTWHTTSTGASGSKLLFDRIPTIEIDKSQDHGEKRKSVQYMCQLHVLIIPA